MAYVTVIGSAPEQVEYRLEAGHGCSSDRRFSYHADGSERPLMWIGAGLPEVGITPGAAFTAADLDRARAIMAGLDPRTGEVLVPRKVAVCEDAKVALVPLVAAIQATAGELGVDVARLLGGNAKALADFGRAERAVTDRGDGALLRADRAGRLARAAGLDAEAVWGEAYTVAIGNLTELVVQRDEDGVEQQVRRPRRQVVGNAGYDITFTLPKSMSLLLAFTDEATAAALERVYQSRVGDTFDWLERQTSYGMRGHHGEGATADTVATSGFLGWSMVHRASRPVGAAEVGDPHWHVHVSVANMAKGADGKWGTVAAGGRDLMRHAPAADHVLKAMLRHDLTTRFGVTFARSARTGAWEVAVIPDDVLRLFSKRGVSIEAMLTDLGFDPATASRRAQVIAEKQTRQAKTHVTAAADATLRDYWQAEAAANGHDPGKLARRALRGKQQEPGGFDAHAIAAQVLAQVIHPDSGVTADMRRFSRVEALAAVADAIPQGAADLAQIEAVTDAVLQAAHIIELDSDTAPVDLTAAPGRRRQLGATHMRNAQRFTTVDVINAEHTILTYAGAAQPGQGAAAVSVTAAAMTRTVVETQQGFALSAEQAAVLQRLVTSDQLLDAVVGVPGSGKTTLMRAVRAAYEAGGYQVAGAATAAVAAHHLQAEAGIEAATVAQWLARIQQSHNARLWVSNDFTCPPHIAAAHPELAGLVLPPADQERCRQAAEHGGLAAVAVLIVDEANLTDDRDRAQLYQEAARTGTKVIEIGDPQQLRGVGCGSLFGRVHEEVAGAALTENRRQHDPEERAAIAAWRDGHHRAALSSWAARDRVVATETGDAAVTAMVAEWMRQRQGAPDAFTEMRGLVMLAATNDLVDRLNDAAQAVRAASGELGKEHTYSTVTGRDVHFAVGDHVMVRLNDRNEQRHIGADVLNGYRAVVRRIHRDRSVTVTWPDDSADGSRQQTARLPATYIRDGGLTLGYALTTHKAEGLTVSGEWDRPDGQQHRGAVLVAAAGMDEAGLHVATTRHKDQVVLFAGRDQVEDLNTTLGRDEPATAAERVRRVLDALTRQAQRTQTAADDTAVHDDLNMDPAADARQQISAADRDRLLDVLRNRTPWPQVDVEAPAPPEPEPDRVVDEEEPQWEPPQQTL